MALNIGELTGYLNLDPSKFKGGVSEALGALKSRNWKVAGAAAGALAAGALAVGFKGAMDMQSATKKVAAQLDLTKDEAAKVGKAAGELYAGNIGDSMGDVNDIIGSVISNIDGMRGASKEDLEKMSTYAYHFANTMGVDVADSTKAVGLMVRNGMVPDAEAGFDLLAKSATEGGKDMAGPIISAMDKFGPRFAELGLDGEQTMAILVEGSKKGSKGIDAAGRSVRRMGDRVTDLNNQGAQDTLTDLGLDGQEMANKMLAGGDDAKEAMGDITGALLSVEDPAQQAAMAGKLFGQDLRNLGKDSLPAFLESLSGSGEGLGEVDGAMGRMAETLNDTAQDSLETFGRGVQVELIDMMTGAVDWLTQATGGLGNLIKYVQPAVVALGILGGTVAAINLGMKAWQGLLAIQKGAIAVATGVQWAWNAALTANPIGLVVAAIALLVGGLVLFFTKTETGQKIWDKVWGGIKATGIAIADWFMGSFLPFFTETIPGAFQSVLGWVTDHWPLLLGILTGPIGLAVGYIIQHWDEVKAKTQQVFQAIVDAIVSAWGWIKTKAFNPVIRFVTKTIPDGFALLQAKVAAVWLAVRTRLAAGWQAIKSRVFDPVIRFVTRTIPAGFQALKTRVVGHWVAVRNKLQDGYRSIKARTLDPLLRFVRVTVPDGFQYLRTRATAIWGAIRASLHSAYSRIKSATFDPLLRFVKTTIPGGFQTLKSLVTGKWDAMKNKLRDGYTWIKSHVMDPLKNLITKTIPDAFKTGVDSAGRMFDKLKAKTKGPVNFVIDPVYAGIRKLWNPVAKTFGKSSWNLPSVAKLAAGDRMDRVGSGFTTGGAQAIVGEGRRQYPEYVIPTDPRYRQRAQGLHDSLGHDLGQPQMMAGGGALGKIKGLGSKVIGWAKDAAANLDDPVGWIKGKVGQLTAGIGESRLAKTLATLPGKLLGGIKSKLSNWGGSGGGGNGTTGKGGSLAVSDRLARKHGLTMTSGYRPGARTSSGSLSMHGLGRAHDYSNGVDTPQERAFFLDVMRNTKPTELLHTRMGAMNIHRGGGRYGLSGALARMHHNHVHVAYRKGGQLGGIGGMGGEQLDGYRAGTVAASPGWHMVGEAGPELVKFRGGEQVKTTEDTARHLAGSIAGASDDEMERFARIVAAEVRLGSRDGVADGLTGSAGRARTTARMGAL